MALRGGGGGGGGGSQDNGGRNYLRILGLLVDDFKQFLHVNPSWMLLFNWHNHMKVPTVVRRKGIPRRLEVPVHWRKFQIRPKKKRLRRMVRKRPRWNQWRSWGQLVPLQGLELLPHPASQLSSILCKSPSKVPVQCKLLRKSSYATGWNE